MQVGGAIADALGLVSPRHIVIDIPLEGPVTITVTFLPTKEEMERVATIVREEWTRQYRLVPLTDVPTMNREPQP